MLGSLREPNRWALFEAVAQISDKRKTDATLLLDDVRSWLKTDELALGGLAEKLIEAEGRAIELLKPPKTPPPQPDPQPQPQPTPGWRSVATGTKAHLGRQELTTTAEELGSKLASNPKLRVTIQWTIEEQETP